MPPTRPLYRHAQLDRLLNPRSIAIIGASARPGAFGERVLANLCDYRGAIHLVNSRYDRIGDRPCHPAITSLAPVDCAVITVAREAVEGVVEDCIAAAAGGMIIFASGYAETGKQDRIEQQTRLVQRARGAGIPLIGPNCIGAVNHRLRSRITFMPYAAMPPPAPGAIGIVSQSGALGFSMEQAMQHGAKVSHVLTSGNAADVDTADYVAFLADDPDCSVIAVLFEGMADPQRLMRACERALACGKPVVVCKLATGEFGAQAAMSHTGSLAGSQAAYRAAFARAGVVMVDDFEALMETASFFAKAPARPKARGVAILATSGGAAIMAADKAEKHGIPLPQPEPPAQAVLLARIPEFGSTRNPVDVTAQVMNDPLSLPACADALMDDPNFGAMVIPMVFAGPLSGSRVPYYNALSRRAGKPVINVWLTEWLEGTGSAAMEADPATAIFRSMDRCFATLAAWHARADRLEAPPRAPRLATESAHAASAAVLRAAGPTLSEREAKLALAPYGIPVVQETLVQTADEAVAEAARIGYPVVVKVESPDLPHKTEAGVIRLGLKNEADLRAAFAAVMANADRVEPKPRIVGVLVQPMVPTGVEVMIGARVDPLFGPLIVVGLGGVLVELLKDTALGLAPVGIAEATAMLHRLKGRAALEGFRGSAPVDIAALAEIVARASEFIADHADEVAELDINPLICDGARILAVDALIVKG